MLPPILLADGELIGSVVPVIIVLIWIVAQIIRNVNFGEPRKNLQRDNPPVRQPVNVHVDQEIEDFLRRVTERKAAGAPRKVLRQNQDVPLDEEVIEVEVIDEPLVGDGIGGRLERPSFDQISSNMGRHVGEVDEEISSQLHKKFDHQVGRLAAELSEDDQAAVSDHPDKATAQSAYSIKNKVVAGVDISAMLRNPRSLRQAIILKEVFDRRNFEDL